jgi:hypothetical protein
MSLRVRGTGGTRWVEATGFPVSLILVNSRSAPLLVPAVIGEEKKGHVPRRGILTAIRDLDRLCYRDKGLVPPKSRRARTAMECMEAFRAIQNSGVPDYSRLSLR